MFNAVSTNSTTGTVEYTLLNPTTFVAAAKEIGMFAVPTDESEVHSANNYINNGGWFWVEHEDYTKVTAYGEEPPLELKAKRY